ncbi:MAG TPA: hypothetical protein VJ349_21885 [Stellaceae bacterium]|nr:hypothetical protein [Stellaceae bacterium]
MRIVPLREVARDLSVSHKLARRIADRIDDNVGPKSASILAHTPSLAFESAVFGGGGESERRQACRAVFVGVEARKALTENFGLLISLEAARTRVPAGYSAIGIEHIDGVISHRIDKKTIAAELGGLRLLHLKIVL